jgi:hypothetical protein
MDKWPEDYECDGQLSLFPVEFEKCMNPPTETEKRESDEKIQSKPND